MSHKHSLSPLVLTACLCWPLVACQQGGPPPGALANAAVSVKLAPVETGTLAETSEFNARLESRQSITLQPQVSGQISEIFVGSGQFVTTGTPILQIDPAEQAAAVGSTAATVEAAAAAIASAAAEIKTATDQLSALEAQRRADQATLEFNQDQYRRNLKLFEQGAISRLDLNNFDLQVKTAQANLSRTEAEIQAQRAAVAQRQATLVERQKELRQNRANTQEQQVRLDYYRITAPFSGRVGEMPVKQGDYVTPSSQLFRLTENQPLEVQVAIPIERAAEVRQGLPIQLLNPQGEVVGTSQVFFIAPNVNNNTQSVLVKALFENSDNQLRADQQIRARVIWAQRSGVLVPTTAVTNLAGENFVFVAATDAKSQLIARQKPVKLGEIQGNRYQVLSGLQPGDRLVVSGIQKLADGVPIAPES